MMRCIKYLCCCSMLFVALAFNNSIPDELNGNAVKISDGDTFTLLTPGKAQVKIRLSGIDAPEKGQDYWIVSRDFLGKMLSGQLLRVRITGKDKYGRLIGDVYAGKLWVNSEMIEAGLAWHFLKYSSNPDLAKAEASARAHHAGLWKQPSPTPPWDYRSNRKRKP